MLNTPGKDHEYSNSRDITPEGKISEVQNQTWPSFYGPRLCVSISNDFLKRNLSC